MTVAELVEALYHLDPDALVVLAKDTEGNGYSPLAELEAARYVAETTWNGYLLDEGAGPREDAEAAVALWPVN